MAGWPEEKQAGYPLNGKCLRKIRLFINFPFDLSTMVLIVGSLMSNCYFIKKNAMDLRPLHHENPQVAKASFSIRMSHIIGKEMHFTD